MIEVVDLSSCFFQSPSSAMKFCKKYEQYMQQKQQKLPKVACKKLKKILKKCRLACQSQKDPESNSNADGVVQIRITSCHNRCPGICILNSHRHWLTIRLCNLVSWINSMWFDLNLFEIHNLIHSLLLLKFTLLLP